METTAVGTPDNDGMEMSSNTDTSSAGETPNMRLPNTVPMETVNIESGEEFTQIEEGKARILFPNVNSVFYNNVQVFNRDISVAVIKYFIQLYQHNPRKPATCQNHQEIKFSAAVKHDGDNDTHDRDKDKHNGDKNSNENHNSTTIDDGDDMQDSVDNNGDVAKGSVANNNGDNNGDNKGDNLPTVNIMEALSATGLRAIRYALEIPNINKIVANDLSKQAVTSIERNIQHNGVADIVTSSNADASMLLYESRFPLSKRFQVIDLDPYGSPCAFLDGAVQAVDEGGLLCITCTDMGALCGNHGEAAYAKYGSLPFRAKYCHEMALRIVLACLDTHAGRYKRYIKPLLSLSADFYIRVFVRVFTSASETKRSASKKSYVFHCNGCETFTLQPLGFKIEEGASKKYKPGTGPVVGKRCEECGFVFKIGGPIWSEPMHDVNFVNGVLTSLQADGKESYKTYDRILGSLTLVCEELQDRPLYLVLDNLCNIIHCPTPSQTQFRSALIHAGYKVSGTHANESGFKTTAPISVIWDILRCWFRTSLVADRKNAAHTATYALLSKEAKINANFEILPEATPQSKILRLSRFPTNPESDWGPKARAKQSNRFTSLADKRKELQGKRQRSHKQDPKSILCKKYKRGECNRGDGCRFAHTSDKTVACKKFQRGDCTLGKACRFAHSASSVFAVVEKTSMDVADNNDNVGAETVPDNGGETVPDTNNLETDIVGDRTIQVPHDVTSTT